MKGLFVLAASMLYVLAAAGGAVEISIAGPERVMISAGAGQKEIKVGLTGSLSGLTVRGEVRKWGEEKAIGTIAPVAAKSVTVLSYQFPQPGIYRIDISVERGKEKVATETGTYSVVPKFSERPEEMGACTHFAHGKGNDPLTFELLKLAGFTRLRDDLAWEHIEPKAKQYRIPDAVEKFVHTANQYGMKPLIVTGYNNNRAYPGKFSKAFPTTPEMWEAYGDAVAFAVKHFGPRVEEWELWNEPNAAHPVNDYLPMLKVVYPKIKAVRPEAIVISCGGGGAGGGPGGAMIQPIAGAGGIEFQDGFSIHPYMAPHNPDFGYRADGSPIPAVNIPVFTKHLRTFAERNPKQSGAKLKFYITELGWPTEYESLRELPVTEMAQAAYLARTFLLNRANGNQPLYWYDFQNDGTDPMEKEHNFGLINLDFSPKPAYQAAAVFAALLGNKAFSGPILEGSVKGNGFDKDALKKGLCKAYVYSVARNPVVALWSAEPTFRNYRIEFKLPFPYERAKLIDWQGTELPMPKLLDGNRVEMLFTILPKYIVEK